METHSKYEAIHLRNLSLYGKRILNIYNKYIDLIFIRAVGIHIPEGQVFDIKKYPVLLRLLDDMAEKMQNELKVSIVNGVQNEWSLANAKNDEWIDIAFKKTGKKVPDAIKQRFFNKNLDAMQAFIERQEEKMNLSKRIWRLKSQYRQEIEAGLQLGITEGKPAVRMATEMKQYLRDPDKLFRRVKNKCGKLVLSKAAQEYHPGQGKYRSSFKNALRLTRNETNMAYRSADHERWKKENFVLGFEVKLSNSHPRTDICNDLIGKYPKTFKFRAWHPQCYCYAIPIRSSEETFDKYIDSILDGTDNEFEFTGAVEKVPEGLTTWIDKNKGRVKAWKHLPYFIRDNKNFISLD